MTVLSPTSLLTVAGESPSIAAQDIVNRALQRLGILQIGTVADGVQTMSGLRILAEMLDGLGAEGVALTPNIPLQPQYAKAVVDLLAVEMAPEYGIEPTPYLARRSSNGLRTLQSAFIFAPKADFDAAIRNLPSQRLIGQRGVPMNVADVMPNPAPQITGFVLLSTNVSQTTWNEVNCHVASTMCLTPYTRTANDEWERIRPTVATGEGSFVVTHACNMINDRIFRYTITVNAPLVGIEPSGQPYDPPASLQGVLTLAPGATNTTQAIPGMFANARITLEPTTANAASILPFVYRPVAGRVSGSVTFDHPSNDNTDLTFNYVVINVP